MNIPNKPIQRITQVYNNQNIARRPDNKKQANRSDEVELSHQGREIHAIMHGVKNAPDIRPRAEEIREEITSGTYQVSGKQIAAGILKALQKGW